MSKLISLKISDDIFEEAERFIRKNKTTRNAYINQALKLMNHFQERQKLRKTLQRESHEVSAESKIVLKEFEAFQDENLK